ncbi:MULTISPECIES: hydrolase [Bacillus]|jgi:nicotinamidase-related amidase|uniref:hydrolase n=1 Tax=Bacillus TaxID=1386 RepID=UPI000C32D370|nr:MULTISPECIES: hydrolase [Bacillus cereus group]AUD21352.1 amidohydrolase [Bacillus sp. HBCD-sjtu]NKW84134.1 hydrolase [Bacillus cereus]HDR4389859.1 hydrolase [Bacillus cereus]HDR4600448.1 hydrolase [Bacillus cereus]HDR4658041.1 hydrolase [Bacillus cereus]
MTNKHNNVFIDPNDTALLLIDHQSGLFQTVKDMDVPTLRRNVIALAKLAKLTNLPTITTDSVPQGPNGPLIPEVKEILPDLVYVARNGEINAWDNPNFVKAVEATGKKTLIIAGTLTSVCMAFPTLSALAEGYKVYTVVDASGNWSKMATDITLARVIQAGAIPIDTLAVMSEIQKTWNRPDAKEFADIYAEVMPNYGLLIESYQRAYDEGQKSAGSENGGV